jgi:hypothetical protein
MYYQDHGARPGCRAPRFLSFDIRLVGLDGDESRDATLIHKQQD